MMQSEWNSATWMVLRFRDYESPQCFCHAEDKIQQPSINQI